MIALDFGLGEIEQDFWRVFFLMIRIGAALVAAPLFGGASVPPVARICVTGALAMFAAIWLPAVETPPNLLSLAGLLAAAGEILVGLVLGFLLQLAFAAPQIGAEMIGGSMGFSMAMAVDPNNGTQSTAFGQYFSLVLTLIFLAVGAHLQWLALVMESYRAFPPGHTWLAPDRYEMIGSFAGMMFSTGLRIAIPVSLILLLVQVVTGVLSRSAPSLNLFAIGLPAGVLAGLAALIISAPLIYDQFIDLIGVSLGQVQEFMIP